LLVEQEQWQQVNAVLSEIWEVSPTNSNN